MAKKATTPQSPVLTDSTAAEELMGMFLLAFGQGVNPLHVRLKVVTAIRTALLHSQERVVTKEGWKADWQKDAASVLGFMTAVGRLSAHLALSNGRTIIEPSDFVKALRLVKDEHHFTPTGPVFPLGKYCN